MADSKDIQKALSAVFNISKKFQSFSVVAEILGELGDVQKQYEFLTKEKDILTFTLGSLDKEITKARVQAGEVRVELEEAITNRDKEFDAQESIAEDISNTAKVKAKGIIDEACVTADNIRDESSVMRGDADRELSKVQIEVNEAKVLLTSYENKLADFKANL